VPLNEQQYVYVVGHDMKAERREVKIGMRVPGFVEVVSGLKAGEKVVVDGTIRLRPGATVKIADERKGERKNNDKGGGVAAAGPRT
jgi:membrane fusion protein (multidrug efflux system)